MNTDEHVSNSEHCMLASGEAHDDERPNVAMLNAIGGVQQALLAAVSELMRLNDGRDSFHREVLEVLTRAKAEVCGESNYEYIDPGFRRPQDVVTCQRKEGHPRDFHEGSGRRWYPENRRSSEGPSGAGATAQVAEKEGP